MPAGYGIEVNEELITKERRYGGHQAGYGFQAFIQGLVGSDLVGLVLPFPEPAAAKAHIPIAEVFIHEVLDQAAGLRRLIVVKSSLRLFNQGMQARQDPAVNLGPLFQRDISLPECKSIHVGIKGKELIRII